MDNYDKGFGFSHAGQEKLRIPCLVSRMVKSSRHRRKILLFHGPF